MTAIATRPFHHSAARVGLAAKGLMYLLLGIVVAQLAWPGAGGQSADGQGALRTLAAQPAGRIVLAALTAGFAAYAAWQARCAISGEDAWPRLTAGLRAVLWAGLGVNAARLVIGAGVRGDQEESVTARLLATTPGVWLVAVVGAAIVVAALLMLRRLRRRQYLEDLQALRPRTRRAVTVAATIGITARTVVYTIAGAFLIRAALTHEPERGVGLDGALSQVAQQPFGRYLLAAAAVGLVAYAVWCVVRARYEDLNRSDG